MRNTKNAMRVVSIKLPEDLDEELTEIAKRLHTSRSAILREALEAFARGPRRSVTAAAGHLVGSLHGPRDLSTSDKHMAGYGE
jgi:metal-responsive CopG/Arc/MetJ family transcriptional regulator